MSGGTIVVFGSVVQDLISYTDRFPNPGESVRGKSFQLGAGGKGANAAVAAARLGSQVTFIGRVFGGVLLASEESLQAGIDTHLLKKSNEHGTATATITVSSEGENSIVVTLGANLEMTAKVAREHAKDIAKASLILCQAEIPQDGNLEAFTIAKKHGVATFFNPAPGDPNLNKAILEFTDIICTNENETEFLTNLPASTIEEAKVAAKEMLGEGPQIAIITLGPKGCIVAKRDGDKYDIQHVPSPKVTAVDTTGAGDCFCGSLAFYLVEMPDLPVVEAARRAACIAANSVTRKGTQSSYFSRHELDPSLFIS